MKSIIVTSENGLHARPASMIVKACQEFKSDIVLKKGAHEADARSIMNIMAMGIVEGDEIIIEATGEDAEAAEQRILDVIEGAL